MEENKSTTQIIEIYNCKNVKHAEISVTKGALNILFGHNGTGKSSICQALQSQLDQDYSDEKKKTLIPYSKINDGTCSTEVVNCDYKHVKVFNMDYINNYVFVNDDDLYLDDNMKEKKSFRVLLSSPEVLQRQHDLNDRLKKFNEIHLNIKDAKNPAGINEVRNFLNELTEIIKTNDNGKINKRGGIKEVLNGKGAGFDRYSQLNKFSQFYENRDLAYISKWSKWKTDGDQYVSGELCPYCAQKLDLKNFNDERNLFKDVFKKSALSTVEKINDYLEKGISNGIISESARDRVTKYFGDKVNSSALESEMQHLLTCNTYLNQQLTNISIFSQRKINLKNVGNLQKILEDMKIDKDQLGVYYTATNVLDFINEINKLIDDMLNDVGTLQELMGKYNTSLKRIISNRKAEINCFLKLADFPYEFEIDTNNGETTTYLTPRGLSEYKVPNVNEHLSWGERNSFALIMFMYDAINDQSDFIILDDPIESFDDKKKFSVIRRLFEPKKSITSFYGNTVLMLTHDLQPIIDYVKGDFLKQIGLAVNAEYLQNISGVIKSIKIEETDLKNVVELTEKEYKDPNNPFHVRVVNMRKNIELTAKKGQSDITYQLLSNLIHGREVPQYKNEEGLTNMDEKDVKEAVKDVNEKMGTSYSSYEKMKGELDTERLKSYITISNDLKQNYEYILALRLILERDEELENKIHSTHPEVTKFLNETNHIENDYLFQLDPMKYFQIPRSYQEILKDLVFS